MSIRAPPALLSSSVHLALSGLLCIPGPQDAHSVHPQPKSLGWVGSTPRLFITTRRLHIHGGAAAQAGNRLLLQLSCSNQWSVTQALPQSSGRAAQPFQAVDAGAAAEERRRWVLVVQVAAMHCNAAAEMPQPSRAHISSSQRQNQVRRLPLRSPPAAPPPTNQLQ